MGVIGVGLFQADILWDYGFENEVSEILSELRFDIPRYVRAIRERAKDSENSQSWLELRLPNLVDSFLELNESGEGKEASGHRNQEFIAGHKRIDGKYAK